MASPTQTTIPGQAPAAIWLNSTTLEVRDLPVSSPGTGEVLLRVRACGICGSDLHGFHTGTRQVAEGMGPGHELAGEVVAVGPDVRRIPIGARVVTPGARVCGSCGFCRAGRFQLCPRMLMLGVHVPGGMSRYLIAQAQHLYRVPDELPWEVAALWEPLGVAVHGLRRAGLRRGQRVLVLGAGTIGLFSALVARDAGAARVGITARYPHQAAAARLLGATDVFDPDEVVAGSAVAAMSWDIVVETVGGSAPTLQQAIDVVERGGTVALLGVHTEPQTIQPFRVFFHELSIVGCLGYDETERRSDGEEALSLLVKYQAEAEQLITHRFPLERVGDAFVTALDKRSGAIKVTVVL